MDSVDLGHPHSISVVILAKNEENTINEIVKGSVPFADAVLVMDGRSTDSTVMRAREAGAIVHEDSGKGKGAAIRQSLDLVSGDIVVFIDSDGSHDPADVPRLVAPIIRGEADLCVGSRFAGGSDELSITFGQLVRSVGNILMNIAINKRWGVELTDTLNGFRAIRCSVARQLGLKENRHTIEQEMVMRALRNGWRVVNVPTHEYSRKYGGSHINIWREWPTFVWCVLRHLARRDVPATADRRVTSRSASRNLEIDVR